MKKALFLLGLALTVQMSFAQTEAKQQADALNAEGTAKSKIADEESKKIYLHLPYDTATFYNATVDMYEAWMKCDPFDVTPDAKGKVKPKYRASNAARLFSDKPNLINGGIYFFGKEDYAKAEKCFRAYVDFAEAPMVADKNLVETDTLLPIIGHYATVASLKNKDYDAAIKYSAWGVKSSEGKASQEFKAEAYKEKGDMNGYIEALKEGLFKFPQDGFFMSNLIDYYLSNKKLDEALAMANELVQKDENNYYNWFIKGYLLWEAKKYNEAIPALQKSIDLKGDFAMSLTCMGDCYQMQSQEYDKNTPRDKYDMKVFREFYAKALPYYEKAYQLEPSKTLAQYLYRCYYNTGNEAKTKEFEALQNK